MAAYGCAAIFCIKKLHGIRLVTAFGLAACALAIFLLPWVIRNDVEMGEPILLRSNLGLELAMANYQGALEAQDPLDQVRRRFDQIHLL